MSSPSRKSSATSGSRSSAFLARIVSLNRKPARGTTPDTAMHCNRFLSPPLSRRQMLLQCANGFGALALAALLGETGYGAALSTEPDARDPLAPRPPHFRAREHGRPIRMKVPPTQFNNVGSVLQSPWKFRRHGQSGIPVSELFPHVATC